MVTEEDRQFMWEFYSPDPRQRINLGIRRRLAPLMGNDRRKIEVMKSMLFTLPGTPIIYYGDEIGMGDNIQLFDRNGVRTPMQWDDSQNGGFSVAPIESLYAPPISDPDYGYNTVNVAAARADESSMLYTIRQMIARRKAMDFVAKAELVWLDDLPENLLCFWRESDGGKLLALHNLSDEEATVDLPDGTYSDALWPDKPAASGTITLAPYAYRWLLPE